jgi:hypothetical protein
VSAPQDGQFTGEKGRVSASKIAAALGLGGPDSLKKPDKGTGRPLKSPAQVRAEAEGKPVPQDPPGFKRTVVEGGRDAWEFFGRPATAPLGSQPEGQPIEPEFLPREEEERIKEARGENPQRVNWDRVDEQRKAREVGKQFEKAQEKLRALLRKEAAIEAARQKRRGR